MHYKNNSQLQQDYASSMAEAVSINFKGVTESIVNDLNDYFAKQPSSPPSNETTQDNI